MSTKWLGKRDAHKINLAPCAKLEKRATEREHKQRGDKEQETGDGPCKVTACGPNTTNSQEGSGRGSSGSCQGLRLCKHRRSQTHACCRQHVQTEEVLTVMLLFWRMAPEVRLPNLPTDGTGTPQRSMLSGRSRFPMTRARQRHWPLSVQTFHNL